MKNERKFKVNVELPGEVFSVLIPMSVADDLQKELEAAKAKGDYSDFKKKFGSYRVGREVQQWEVF